MALPIPIIYMSNFYSCIEEKVKSFVTKRKTVIKMQSPYWYRLLQKVLFFFNNLSVCLNINIIRYKPNIPSRFD